jgi:hypothetical protein
MCDHSLNIHPWTNGVVSGVFEFIRWILPLDLMSGLGVQVRNLRWS